MTDRPIAYLHTLHMDLDQEEKVVTFEREHPFGRCGVDYDPDYTVTTKPLGQIAAAPEGAQAGDEINRWLRRFDVRGEAGLARAELAALVACGYLTDESISPNRRCYKRTAAALDELRRPPPATPSLDAEDAASWIDRAAFCASELLATALHRVEPARDEGGSTLNHCRWMAEELAAKRVGSGTKACRWLGYLQGQLIAWCMSTLECEKDRNLRSAAGASAPQLNQV